MNDLQRFEFDETMVRTVDVDGQPWFVAKDVATVLGYDLTTNMTRVLDEDEKGIHETNTLGGTQKVSIISEPGLYRAIIQRQTGRMTDPAARQRIKDFQRWITAEVLPAIRKTGTYSTAPAQVHPELVSRADLARMVLEAEEEKQVMAAALEAAAPAIAYHDRYVANGDAALVRVWAAQFGISDPKAREMLLAAKVIYRFSIGWRWSQAKQRKVEEYEYRPYARYIEWFDLRPQHEAPRYHNGQVRQTLYIRQEFALQLGAKLGLAPVHQAGDAA
ncbi:BRO family protein [Arthrobacter sp. JSM 101049]|uniref:BRO family protein n=1 Tax=Arthrobacter sp. JSM 101049 TaxID=929097 RepID=UPI003562A699